MTLKNNYYDKLKFVATTLLPAFITFVGTVGVQMGYEMTTPVVILTAFNTFLGTCLHLSNINYKQELESN